MRAMSAWFRPVVRKSLVFAVLLAFVAMPMAFAGVGFCRSMPCCPPHLAAHLTSLHQPDCCSTSNCDQAPATASEYTPAKQIHEQHGSIALAPAALVPTTLTLAPPVVRWDASPPLPPPALQRRIALLSTLLI
jgi:hypothetical protein